MVAILNFIKAIICNFQQKYSGILRLHLKHVFILLKGKTPGIKIEWYDRIE